MPIKGCLLNYGHESDVFAQRKIFDNKCKPDEFLFHFIHVPLEGYELFSKREGDKNGEILIKFVSYLIMYVICPYICS